MKTIKTTARVIALSLIVSLAINVTVFASTERVVDTPYYSDAEMISLLDLNSELDELEHDLIAEGIFACENTDVIVVLGEDDEIVYQGTSHINDGSNAFLTRLLTKADYIMSSGGKNFYKVF